MESEETPMEDVQNEQMLVNNTGSCHSTDLRCKPVGYEIPSCRNPKERRVVHAGTFSSTETCATQYNGASMYEVLSLIHTMRISD